MARILVPLPARDFDPTEVAVPWKVLTARGHAIVFATPDGKPADADEMMLTGQGLDIWGAIPGLRAFPAFGLMLRANRCARACYDEMRASAAFQAPVSWLSINPDDYDGMILPGGHRARGMRAYLESPVLQSVVAAYFAADKPVGAICHGVLLAARSKDLLTGRSVLHGRRTTALTWALEKAAWSLARVMRFWDRDYYRTYSEAPGQPAGYMSVQQEVSRALAAPSDFVDVSPDDPHRRRKTSGLARDTISDASPAFVVRDQRYVSARWPGDAHTFAQVFAAVLEEEKTASQGSPAAA